MCVNRTEGQSVVRVEHHVSKHSDMHLFSLPLRLSMFVVVSGHRERERETVHALVMNICHKT